jgi:Flp pilus assembly protein TadG
MVALPFLALIMGTLEIAMIYLVSTTLENATADVARQIRTGQLQASCMNQTQAQCASGFTSAICGELSWLGSGCSTNLYVDVRTFASFSSMSQPSPVTNGDVDSNKLQFSPGSAGTIVLVRSFYQWTLFTPVLDQLAASLNGGSTLITATAAFKNEPYGTTS